MKNDPIYGWPTVQTIEMGNGRSCQVFLEKCVDNRYQKNCPAEKGFPTGRSPRAGGVSIVFNVEEVIKFRGIAIGPESLGPENSMEHRKACFADPIGSPR
jgi:hypothetical protein